jgi:hypothetical protein
LKCPDLNDVVNITAKECYISHLIPSDNISDFDIEEMKLTIGRLCKLQNNLVAYRLIDSENGFELQNVDRIVETKNAIKNNLDLLLSLQE